MFPLLNRVRGPLVQRLIVIIVPMLIIVPIIAYSRVSLHTYLGERAGYLHHGTY
jgi:hypothetical protein